MKKEEYIKKYGKKAWAKKLQQTCNWKETHPEEISGWKKENQEKIKANEREASHKGGKYYEHRQQYFLTGLQHKKRLVRGKHNRFWTPYKQIIAPASQIHHEWIPTTADYTGVALVEAEQHLHGFIDVIQILEGELTLLRED